MPMYKGVQDCVLLANLNLVEKIMIVARSSIALVL